MRKFLLSIFCLFIFSHAFSQAEFHSGFYIDFQGDTVRGYVNIMQKGKCKFRASENNKSVLVFLPGDIAGFGFENGKYFASIKVTNKYGIEVNEFAECLISGKATLYKWKSIYFVQMSDSTLYELIHKRESKRDYEVQGKKYYDRSFDNKKYIGMLIYLLQDCPDLYNDIISTSLADKPLTMLIEKYNKCTESPYLQYQSHLPWIKAGFSLYTGVIASTLKLESTSYNNLFADEGKPLQDASFVIGSTAYITWPRSINRISLTIGAMYFSTSFAVNSSVSNATYTNYYDGNIKTQELKVPLGLQYAFRQKKYHPFIAGGIANSFLLSGSSTIRSEREYNNVIETNEYELIPFQPALLSYWVALGTGYEFSENYEGIVELRFEGPSYISNSTNTTAQCAHLMFTVGLKFR